MQSTQEFDAGFKLKVVRLVKGQGLLLADINHPNNLLSETLIAGGYSAEPAVKMGQLTKCVA